MKWVCKNDSEMTAMGARLMDQIEPGDVVFFHGNLGAGKTTLIRAYLRALGHEGRIPSPTYGLVEQYDVQGRSICHLDLYRLADPEELEYLGFRDWLDGHRVLLIEWPEKAEGVLPPPNLSIVIDFEGDGRAVECRRWIKP